MITTYVVFDLETSGLDPDQGAEIVQLSAKAVNAITLEYVPINQLTLVLKPQEPEKASPKAIEVIGQDLWQKALKDGLDQKVALKRLIDWLRQFNPKNNKFNRPVMCGHNIEFDFRFLSKVMIKLGIINSMDDFPFTDFLRIDTMTLQHLIWGHRDDLCPNLKLDTLLSITGEKRDHATHDAEEDVEKTANAMVRIMRFLRECQKRMKSTVS